MTDWIDELNERSKDDRAIIVGSEVRALCSEIADLRKKVGVEKGLRAAANAVNAALKTEVQALLAEHGRHAAAAQVFLDAGLQMAGQRDRAVALLRRLEWVDGGCCPICGKDPDFGKDHYPACNLSALLLENP